ncbi:MAG: hypothetical protein JWM11_6593 [Planctomycetaceae bacterium]|nr:hypothetical protein [Planctomycetaceae bacterium]
MNSRRPVVEVMDPMVAEIMRKKTPVERLAIAFNMWNTARVILRGAIKSEHEDWTAEEVNREIAKRISGGVVTDGHE